MTVSVVYVASVLKNRYPAVYSTIATEVVVAGHEFHEVPATNIWVRDWMPIQASNGDLVQFAYQYDTDRWPQLRTQPPEEIGGKQVRQSEIRLDGGNLVRHGKKAICTDIIFDRNPQIDPGRLVQQIQNLLDVCLIVIPHEPGDELGHADGMVSWINDYSCYMADFKYVFYSQVQWKLDCYCTTAVPVPLINDKAPPLTEHQFRQQFTLGDDWNDAWGYYVNMLVLDNLVLVPTFGVEKDNEVLLDVAHRHAGRHVVGVDCSQLSREGGLVNCATWNCEV